jgi:hypothetical protein
MWVEEQVSALPLSADRVTSVVSLVIVCERGVRLDLDGSSPLATSLKTAGFAAFSHLNAWPGAVVSVGSAQRCPGAALHSPGTVISAIHLHVDPLC